MELNLRFAYYILNVFNTESFGTSTQLESNLSLCKNNVFRKSLIVEINNDEVEIPVIAKSHFEEMVLSNMAFPHTMKIEKIILPLYDNALSTVKRTFDSIITQLFTGVSYNRRLQKITTSKGEVYYGGKGIILDGNYTPLLLCTLTARSLHTEGCTTMAYYRPVCHISPKVFLEPDKLINKGIIKKLIPYYVNNCLFPLTGTSYFLNDMRNEKVKVIVDSLDKFFVEPIKPTPSTCSNDALNECLIDNIEDVMMLI